MSSETAQVKKLADDLTQWLTEDALPAWHAGGIAPDTGECFEVIDLETKAGAPIDRRARVAPRQIYSFLEGARLGWSGPAEDIATRLWAWLSETYRLADGTFAAAVSINNTLTDSRFDLYNQAFVLFALAQMADKIPACASTAETEAKSLLETLYKTYKHPDIGFREDVPDRIPLRANPHMHLLEACMAWEAVSKDPAWSNLTDELAELALTRLIDPVNGGLREFFDLHWAPLPGDEGRTIEPGHLFEWAWLLVRWGTSRRDADALVAARRLYDIAWTYGIDESRGAAFMAINDDFSVRDPIARLWGQTEWIKAAIALAGISAGPEREAYVADISLSVAALSAYFEDVPAGLYRDKWNVDGTFEDEPAPASSLYHIVCAISELNAFAKSL
ncbi:AGE family epimerase/isomerase [Labrenzia sp. PHM005]|uniref:AGE family epimerase/isomerase n=1 Tax=Labrenzia sp. PHM005 TaxID=2590016 RepID=UPI00113FD7E5|nr:AGE family epimerase/isomerase [Labrenzia sp. PHM005]QDG77869.1 AGE family epimerase/isomerase [Labrenzia sp. PHM005]